MKPQRGMILELCLDPVKGSKTAKTRPCIVVTNDIDNARVPLIRLDSAGLQCADACT